MEKINKDSIGYEWIKGVLVYFSDLEYLIESFKSAGYTVNIEDQEFKYESLEEVKQKKGIKPDYLKLEVYKINENGKISPYRAGYIEFLNNNTTLSFHETSGLFFQLKDFLYSKISLKYKVANSSLWGVAPGAFWIPFIGPYFYPRLRLSEVPTWANVVLYSLIFTWLFMLFYSKYQFGLRMEYKHEDNWVIKYGKEIILLILGAIITLVVQYVSTFF